jgi:hypothetical protein
MSDELDATPKSAGSALDLVRLKSEIVSLQSIVLSGRKLTPEQQAKMNALEAERDRLQGK